MSSVTRFEELDSWQKARKLTKMVYSLSSKGGWAKDFELRNQIRRAAISAMSNIAEGFERQGANEFPYFLSIAKGSAGEVRSQLYVALDQDYIDERIFEEARELAEETSRLIAGLHKYLKARHVA
jgi:four helix bundle protein